MPRRKTHDEFIGEMASKHPNIEVIGQYQNSSTRIDVRCRVCGHKWAPTPSSLVNLGSGCPKCSRRNVGESARTDPSEFVQRAHEANPLIAITGEYQDTSKRISVLCTRCGYKWDAWPSGILRGARCPACSHGHTSYMEQFIAEALRRLFGDASVESPNRTLIGKELDIYVPAARLAIEPGSWFWHKKKTSKDAIKRELARSKGIRLLTIYDAFPDGAKVPFREDCWTFPIDLGSEAGHETLKDVVARLASIIDPNASTENINWTEIEYIALLRSGMKSTEEFIAELQSIRDDIEVLSDYKGSNVPVRCRCKKCGHEWSPTPHSLLSQQSGCPKCAGSLKKTTEQFIEELRAVNPNIEVLGEYSNIQGKIECRCKTCGHIWSPIPLGLLNGTGCPNCYRMRPSPIQKKESDFIEDLKTVNPEIEVIGNYSGSAQTIKVRCTKCGYVWEPTANSLLTSHGCPSCAGALKKTTDEFASELAGINPNVEVLGEYVTSKTKTLCRCKLCGHKWSPTPNSLLRGYGCPKCAGRQRLDQSSFEERVKGKNPNIAVLGQYINTRTKIDCRCETCGYTWSVLPASLLSGHGCPKCAGKLKKTTAEFVNELAGINPNVEVLGEYVTSKTKTLCRCKLCGHEWSPTPNDLLRRRQCPRCHGKA